MNMKHEEENNEYGSNKKWEIVKAAQRVLATKGISDSSISEIAQMAGVTDSIIYHYFKNKEDLLFWALADRMKDITDELQLHLQGILDPVSKLGKMIWYHLYIYDLHPEDTRVLKNLLFECRSRKSFYSHEGYKVLRSYTGILMSILREGMDAGIFNKNLNPVLVRDMIFGVLDEESLSCYAAHDIEKTMPDFPEIIELVLSMVLDSHQEESGLDKRIRIIKAAEKIFAEKGFDAATMSEIAEIAGVAEGTIYTYFNNKKDLLLSLPIERFRYFKQGTKELFNIKDTLRKLRRFIRYHFSIFLTNRNFLKTFLLDIKLNRQFYESAAYKEYLEYMKVLDPILDEGKEKKLFRDSANNRVFKNLFFGGFTHLTTRWFILDTAKAIDMMEEVDQFVHLLCDALVRKDPIIYELKDRIVHSKRP